LRTTQKHLGQNRHRLTSQRQSPRQFLAPFSDTGSRTMNLCGKPCSTQSRKNLIDFIFHPGDHRITTRFLITTDDDLVEGQRIGMWSRQRFLDEDSQDSLLTLIKDDWFCHEILFH
jgi:hypothetical protein